MNLIGGRGLHARSLRIHLQRFTICFTAGGLLVLLLPSLTRYRTPAGTMHRPSLHTIGLWSGLSLALCQSTGSEARRFSSQSALLQTTIRFQGCGLRFAGCELRSAFCGLRVADCGLRLADRKLRVAVRVLWVASCGLRVAVYGLRFASCGFRVAKSTSFY